MRLLLASIVLICAASVVSCEESRGARQGPCADPAQAPAPEICNGLDDDCDGEVDEGGVCDDPCDQTW